MRRIPFYGLDAPPVVRTLVLLGATACAAAVAAPAARWLWPPGVAFLLTAGYMIWSSRVGKVRQRERLLGRVPWGGAEIVLDIGCGRGLLAVGAAHRLTTGRAVGIDIWQAQDLSGGAPHAVAQNAQTEGVGGRVAVATADMRRLPFADATFDVIVSSLAVHNVPDAAGRAVALAEIARVLKPGGRVLIQDIHCTADYVTAFRALGLEDVERSGPQFSILPWPRIVSARKRTE